MPAPDYRDNADHLAGVKARGFDLSELAEGGGVWIRCSQCAAVCINGIACHETGCPNERRGE